MLVFHCGSQNDPAVCDPSRPQGVGLVPHLVPPRKKTTLPRLQYRGRIGLRNASISSNPRSGRGISLQSGSTHSLSSLPPSRLLLFYFSSFFWEQQMKKPAPACLLDVAFRSLF